MNLQQLIKEGQEGNFTGLDNGLKRVNDYIFRFQRACYYLIGGLSGSAKTTLLDYMLLSAILEAKSKGITVNIHYYCLEIKEDIKKCNWLSVLIFRKHNVLILPQKIRGLGDLRLTPEEQRLVDETLPELEEIWSSIHWTFTSINPTGVYKDMWKFMQNRGTFEYEDYIDEHNKPQKRVKRFTLNDPSEYNFLVADHIALFSKERGFDLKQNLDKLSEYSVTLRNIFGFTVVYLQQFNQGLNNFERQQFKGIDLTPSQNDFKDSTNPYTDADVVLGLMNAFKMQMPECAGYDINKSKTGLKHRFRLLKIIKNRLSFDDLVFGLFFHPEAGRFAELPLPNEMTPEIYERISKL